MEADKWVAQLKKEWIYNVTCLIRVTPEALKRIGLPGILTHELVKILEVFPRYQPPLFTFQEVCGRNLGSTNCPDCVLRVTICPYEWNEGYVTFFLQQVEGIQKRLRRRGIETFWKVCTLWKQFRSLDRLCDLTSPRFTQLSHFLDNF